MINETDCSHHQGTCPTAQDLIDWRNWYKEAFPDKPLPERYKFKP